MTIGSALLHITLVAAMIGCAVYGMEWWAVFFAICFMIAPS